MARHLRRAASFTPTRRQLIEGELRFDGRTLVFVPDTGGSHDEQALKLGRLGIVVDGASHDIPDVASKLHGLARKAGIRVHFERRRVA